MYEKKASMYTNAQKNEDQFVSPVTKTSKMHIKNVNLTLDSKYRKRKYERNT